MYGYGKWCDGGGIGVLDWGEWNCVVLLPEPTDTSRLVFLDLWSSPITDGNIDFELYLYHNIQ